MCICICLFYFSSSFFFFFPLSGTCIRIWDTRSRQLVHELKRSKIGKGATIHSLCFSDDGTMLVVSSSSATIHVFAIAGEKKSDTSFACAHLDDMKITETRHISSFGADNTFIQVWF
jgi:WD40 repeat protein